jgi:MFS family permease
LARSPETTLPIDGNKFYGWFALIGAALSAFVGGGLLLYSYGVFLPVMSQEFGWSRATVGLGMSLAVLSFGLPSPLAGFLTGKFGARKVLIVGNLVGGLGMAAMSQVNEVWQVYLIYSIVGLGCCIGGVIPATTVANNWFVRKRSLAVAIIMALVGLGGFIFPFVTTALLTSVGWRMSWIILGGIFIAIGVIVGSVILVRNKPEDLGQLPDGMPAKPTQEVKAFRPRAESGLEPTGWTMRRILRNPTIWLIIVFGAAHGFVGGTITGHLVAYLRDLGSSPMVAASALSVIAGCGIIGSLGTGFLALKIKIRHLIIACFVIRLIALVILLTSQNIILIYLYTVLFGISTGMLMTAMFTIVGTYYGRTNYARVQGMVFAFTVVLQATGPAIAGAIHDASHTYMPAFIILVAVTFIGLICAYLARPPKFFKVPESSLTVKT